MLAAFWNDHHRAILWALFVVGLVALLIFLTNFFIRLLIKKMAVRFPNEEPDTPLLIRRILRVLWVLLGAMALSFIFIDESSYGAVRANFYLVLWVGLVAVLTLVAASTTNVWFTRSIRQRRETQADYTSYKFLRYLAVATIYFVGGILAILAFPSLRGIAQTALGGAGVLAVVAGVASQEALANLVGGVFIIAFKPFKINDIIKVTESMVGTVTDITLRHTVIRNYENKMIVIPNAIINKEKVINYDLGDRRCCQWIEIGISYGSDIDLAKKILREECEAHPLLVDNRSQLDILNDLPAVVVRVISLDDSAVLLRAWAWAENFTDAFEMRCDLFESVKKRFDREGVEIPFPHRTLVWQEGQLGELRAARRTLNGRADLTTAND